LKYKGLGADGITEDSCCFQVMKAFSEILLEKFVFPKEEQPKNQHHELWQIDK
jgi:hypothetical protein